MNNKSLTALIVGVVVVIAAWNCFYIVAQTERAVLLQFGRVVQADVQPGLHVKVPYVNQVRKFDARLMTLDAPTQRPPASSRLPTSACRVVWNRACVTSLVSAPCTRWCPVNVMR